MLVVPQAKKRARRCDRNHIIYMLTNTVTGETYIGLTVVSGRALKWSLDARWKRHVARAHHEAKEWNLCSSIREHGKDSFTRQVLQVVRGKAEAHREEVRLIKELKPVLNTAKSKI